MRKPELKSIRVALRSEQDEIGNATASQDQRNRLREVSAAIRRIGMGTYGICVDRGEDIDSGRLSAAPSAGYYVTCQEATNIERAMPARWFDTSMSIAA